MALAKESTLAERLAPLVYLKEMTHWLRRLSHGQVDEDSAPVNPVWFTDL
jgi:hypothetical protein